MKHLPECFENSAHRGPMCICDRLRACEQRVRDELPPNGADATWYLLGQRKGLQAARDAVAALPMPPEVPFIHSDGQQVFVRFRDALAAIDALRNDNV